MTKKYLYQRMNTPINDVQNRVIEEYKKNEEKFIENIDGTFKQVFSYDIHNNPVIINYDRQDNPMQDREVIMDTDGIWQEI